MKVKIIHTNDLHGHLEHWPVIRKFIKDRQITYNNDNIPCLTIDVGDAMDTVHPMVEASSGQIMVECFNEIPYDMVTLGNNEGLNFEQETLAQHYAQAKFEVIISNLLSLKRQSVLEWAKPYTIRRINDKTIAFIALTAPYKTYELNGYQIIQPLEAIRSMIDQINQYETNIDTIILLSHLGLSTDRLIAEEFPEISLILGAHTHHVLFEGEHINKTLLAAAGRYGDFVGEVTLEFQTDGQIYSQAQVFAINQLANEYGMDITQDQYYKAGQTLLNQRIVGQLDRPYYALDTESPNSFIQLALDAISWSTEVDLAMLNTGLFLIDLPAGNVSKKDLHEALPHPMHLSKLTLTGEHLIELLDEISSQVEDLQFKLINGLGFRGKIFGEVIFKGIRFDRVNYQWLVKDRPIDFDKVYQIITVDHLWFLPFFPTINQHANPQLIFPDFIRHTLEKYIKHLNQTNNDV